MRDAPTYADAVQAGVVGDDPLGLAPTNENLYNAAFPGFNNYVRHICVYSTICWMTKQVALALERGAAQTEREARELFEGAIEKMELALVWANQGVQGLAGNTRVFPMHDKPIQFRFSAFGSSQATLFDAPTYKPSLTSGLQYRELRSAGTYGCQPLGEALAEAFHAEVGEMPGYRWLKATDKLAGRRSQVEELAPALDVAKPSRGEQTALLASFFPEELGESATKDDKARWLTLNLMLRTVSAVCAANDKAGKPAVATSDAIRAGMARGMAQDVGCRGWHRAGSGLVGGAAGEAAPAAQPEDPVLRGRALDFRPGVLRGKPGLRGLPCRGGGGCVRVHRGGAGRQRRPSLHS
jgi:hypothetical protein